MKEKIYFTKLPHYVDSEKNLTYGSEYSACFDICASIPENKLLYPGARLAIPTGVKFAPDNTNCWLKVEGRSGLALEHGVTPLGGILDTDYRGEPKIILYNTNPPVKRFIELKQDCEVDIETQVVISYKSNKEDRICKLSENFFNNTGRSIIVRYCDAEELVPYGSIFRVYKSTLRVYNYAFIIKPGDRIAQISTSTNKQVEFVEVNKEQFKELSTDRGNGGFGSTGK